MKFILVGLICLIAGILIGKVLFHPKTFGNLRVDRSDPTDAPYLFLELTTDVANDGQSGDEITRSSSSLKSFMDSIDLRSVQYNRLDNCEPTEYALAVVERNDEKK